MRTAGSFPDGTSGEILADGKIKHSFGACNFTLKQDIGERTFVYGGVGAGIVRAVADLHFKDSGIDTGTGDDWSSSHSEHDAKWRFFGQAFGGIGWYLNDNWSLSAGYRLRYLAGPCRESGQFAHDRVKWDWKVKQDIIHAAEVGVTYQF